MIATDADWVRNELVSALGGPANRVGLCRSGPSVIAACKDEAPDLVIVDLQMGNMGGMATCMDLRLEESGGRLPHIPVIMLLDRRADLFLARRSGADGWLLKPLDSIRIRRATKAVLAGGTYVIEGLAITPAPAAVTSAELGDGAETAAS